MYAGNNNLLLTLLQYLHSIYKIILFYGQIWNILIGNYAKPLFESG